MFDGKMLLAWILQKGLKFIDMPQYSCFLSYFQYNVISHHSSYYFKRCMSQI